MLLKQYLGLIMSLTHTVPIMSMTTLIMSLNSLNRTSMVMAYLVMIVVLMMFMMRA